MSDVDERLAGLQRVAELNIEGVTRAAALIAELTATHIALASVLAAITSALEPPERDQVCAVARAAAGHAGGGEAALALVDGLTAAPADPSIALLDLPARLQ